MADAVRLYARAVVERKAAYEAAGGKVSLLVETKVPIEPITGEKGAQGTADCIMIVEFPGKPSLLEVRDFKYGVGVEVEVENNPQLMLYGLGAMIEHGLLHDFGLVQLVIHQPRVREQPVEWAVTPDALAVFGEEAARAAGVALEVLQNPAAAAGHLAPSEKACRFCRAKYKCPALGKEVHETVLGDFQEITDPEAQVLKPAERIDYADLLPVFMSRVGMIEDWCKAVRAEVERRLLEGQPVGDWKLVEGRRGARQWTDEEAAETVLVNHQVPLAEVFKPRELRTPTQIEKAIAKSHPGAWEAARKLIRQGEGKPSVAPASDPRPQWTPKTTAEQFDEFSADGLM